MNRALLYLLMVTLGLTACQKQNNGLLVKNDTPLSQTDRPIVFRLEALHQQFGTPDKGRLVPYDEKGQVIPFQYDDTNGDGIPDELFFQLDVEAYQQKTVSFKASEEIYDFTEATNVFLGKIEGDTVRSLKAAERLDTWDNSVTASKFRAEGICWENDKVGFRNYMDLRNGIDIFGKTTKEMVMDEVGSEALGNYHELAGWGMDILKVGKSLGAGAAALLYRDSLIRVTSANANFEILYEGPLRSAFLLNFKGVDLGDKQIDVAQTIEIQKGKYYYISKVSLSENEGVKLVAGIVNLHETEMELLQSNGEKVLFTFGRQSENNDLLGMAIQVPENMFVEAIDTNDLSEEIPNTYAAVICPDGAYYRFYACWEKSEPKTFGSEESFRNFLEREF